MKDMPDYTPEERAYLLSAALAEECGGEEKELTEKEFSVFRENSIKSERESVYNNACAAPLDRLLEKLKREGLRAVTPASAYYPDALKGKKNAPSVLYAKGDIGLLKTRLFTVVGSRRTPSAALKLGAAICGELSEIFTVVTGAAEGGDSAAMEGALKGGGKVISVLAGGFSALPQSNAALLSRVAERGLLLSAHSFETPVRAFSYESRNALLASLGEGVLVLGAGEKSGALITAAYAEKEGKKIFALPYAPGASAGAGCNALIKKGAYLTENSVDICGRFGINLIKGKIPPALSAEETAVLKALKELAEAHVSELSRLSGVPLFRVYGALSSLEIKGLAARLGGNRYAPVG